MQNDLSLSIAQLARLNEVESTEQFNSQFGSPDKLYQQLRTHPARGISTSSPSTSVRVAKYGRNKLPDRKPKTFLRLLYEAFQDKTMLLLTAAAIVSFALGLYELYAQPPQYDPEGNKLPKIDWIEGIAIMFAVLIVVFVTALNDYQKELQFIKLNDKKQNRNIITIRNNTTILLSIYDLTVGDLINLQTGDVIPADAILVQGSCECDESAITGETDTVVKKPLSSEEDWQCMLISGSKIISGLGKAVVVAVGPNSIHGKTMMMATNQDPKTTPLQERLNIMADAISVYGCLAAILLFIVLFSKFLYNIFSPNGKFHDLTPAQKSSKFLDIFITAITVIVVAVPEGLPLAVTLALAFATTRMLSNGNLVRVLKACETMGSATAVCSDKTGTLTENVMTAVKGIVLAPNILSFDDTKAKDDSDKVFKQIIHPLQEHIMANIVLNSTAFKNEKYSPSSKEQLFIGSKTETALLTLATKTMHVQPDLVQDQRDSPSHYYDIDKIVQIIPFESSRKWSAIVVKSKSEPNKYTCYFKGAAEIISHHCKYIQETTRISTDLSKTIDQTITSFAHDALRAISLAHKEFNDLESWPPPQFAQDNSDQASPDLLFGANDDDDDSGLVLDAIFGIQDPLREGVKDSVMECQKSGVAVRMVTGDNLLTAKAIAKNCNILSQDSYDDADSAMEGPRFRQLDDSQIIKILPKLKVLARSSPEDKRQLVKNLKKMGEVVAVTGDGTNDAPALNLADVGFSMGISGTEVAREASDIILMTDDFSAIVSAIKWGRCVAVSIKKFIQFQLTVNITAVILTFVSAVASEDEKSVLTAVQLLWVNLIMDTLAALALATDKPDPTLMERKPKGRSAPLITTSTWKMILSQSILQLIITFTLHFRGDEIFFPHKEKLSPHDRQQLKALTFNTFVWLQFFTLLVSRKLDEADGLSTVKERFTKTNLNFFQDLFRNYYFLAIMAIIGTCQVLIMFFGGIPFSIERQTSGMWITAILCGSLSLPLGFLVRLCPDEWAVKVFPTKLFNIFIYVVTFEFIRGSGDKHKAEDEESLLSSNETSSVTSDT